MKNSTGWWIFFGLIICAFAITGRGQSGVASPSHPLSAESQVEQEILKVFGGYGWQAQAIAKCESSLDPSAVNQYAVDGSYATGLFQILYPSTWDTTSYRSASPKDASTNIHAAFEIFQRDGYSWREWQCQP